MQTCLKHSAPSLCKSSKLKVLGSASWGKDGSKVKINAGGFKRQVGGGVMEEDHH